MREERVLMPNLMEKLIITAIAVIAVAGFLLFYASMTTADGVSNILIVSALMNWITVIVLLLIGIQLEEVRREIVHKNK